MLVPMYRSRSLEMERRLEALQDPARHALGLAGVGDVFEQDRELVAAEPGDGVAGPDARLEALAERDQELVADEVAEAVVDGLEAVQVQEHDGDAELVAARPRQRVLDAVHEEDAVRQAGQRIVERLPRELLLERLALGDVARVDDDPADGGMVEQVGADRLQVAPGAVAVEAAEVDGGLGGRVGGADGEGGGHAGRVLGVGEVVEAGAVQGVRRVAEDALDGRAVPEDDAVRPEDGHQVRAVLDERAEPILALAQGGLGLLAGADVAGDDDAVGVSTDAQRGDADLDVDAPAIVVEDRQLVVDDAGAPSGGLVEA